MTAREISNALGSHLSRMGTLVMTNVYVLGSPWESDLIRVLKSGYWHEYEIKLSVSDYRADFRKRISSWKPDSPRKHDLYQRDGELKRSEILGSHHYRGSFPKPATFHFVTPIGLLDGVTIPDHCGLIEVGKDERTKNDSVKVVRKSPRLKSPSKLTWNQLFNLCLKR